MLLGLWQKHFSPCHSPSRPLSRRTDSLLQPASGSARSPHASEKSFHEMHLVCMPVCLFDDAFVEYFQREIAI